MNHQETGTSRLTFEDRASNRIELCVHNFPLGSQAAARRLQSDFPDVVVKRWACLGPCEYCARRPFLLVDGREYMSAADADELYDRVCMWFDERRTRS